MPPDGFAVNVTDWPESMLGVFGVIAPEMRALLITMVPVDADACPFMLSVTVTLMLQDETAFGVYMNEDALPGDVKPGQELDHEYV